MVASRCDSSVAAVYDRHINQPDAHRPPLQAPNLLVHVVRSIIAFREIILRTFGNWPRLGWILVFPSANHLSTRCPDCLRAGTDRRRRKREADRLSRVSFAAARAFHNRCARVASKNLSLRSARGAGSCRSRPGLGPDVRSTRFGSTKDQPKHAVLLVRISAPAADSSGSNHFAQHEYSCDSIDNRDRVAVQIAAHWLARSFERRTGRGNRSGNWNLAQFAQSHRHWQRRVRTDVGRENVGLARKRRARSTSCFQTLRGGSNAPSLDA